MWHGVCHWRCLSSEWERESLDIICLYSETLRLSLICQHDIEDSNPPLIITRHCGIKGIVFSEDVHGSLFFYFLHRCDGRLCVFLTAGK